MVQADDRSVSRHALAERAERHFRACAWPQLAGLAAQLPVELDGEAARVADACAFALGQLGRQAEAITLLERAWAVEPTYRRASALAYQHYTAAMQRRNPRARANADEGLSLQTLKDGFRRWLGEALRLYPASIKERYRLGIFEAQIESCHDKVALRAFLSAIQAYRELSEAERERRHDLRKYFVRSLYAGGRSALRLRKVNLARKLSFACIREDGEGRHVARVHQLALAGKACLEAGELDHAERAFRLALDAPGPPRRDHLFGSLADVARRRGQLAEGARFIEAHVRPERRSAALWRKLGDLLRDMDEPARALVAYEAALGRDRKGRHLTLTAIGGIQLAAKRWKKAERAYREAIRFRRRHYLSEHAPAIEGLERALRGRGRDPAGDPLLAPVARATCRAPAEESVEEDVA